MMVPLPWLRSVRWSWKPYCFETIPKRWRVGWGPVTIQHADHTKDGGQYWRWHLTLIGVRRLHVIHRERGPYFEPRDLWRGVFWEKVWELGVLRKYSVYVIVIPCFPIRFSYVRLVRHQ